MKGAKYPDKKAKKSAKWFRQLYKIDRAAYFWIKENRLDRILKSNLSSAFVWVNTPQGHNYWRALHEELNLLNREEQETVQSR